MAKNHRPKQPNRFYAFQPGRWQQAEKYNDMSKQYSYKTKMNKIIYSLLKLIKTEDAQ